MKNLRYYSLLATKFAILLSVSPVSATPLKWTNSEGKSIIAEFVRVEGESVVVKKDGKAFTIPFAKLTPESAEQAKKLSGIKAPPPPAAKVEKSTVPQTARADEEGDFAYSIANDGVTITKYTGKDTEVIFPAKIKGHPVVAIGAGRDRPVLGGSEEEGEPGGDGQKPIVEKVIVPEGVSAINMHAFANCDALLTVSLPKSLKSIGMGAFFPCRKLKSISIPSGVSRIEDATFKACDSLESVELPANLVEIGAGAFWFCGNLKSVSIPPKVIHIGAQSFQSTGLSKVTIPASVTEIGFNAFYGCKNLTSATFEGNIPPSYGKGKSPYGNKVFDDYQNVFLDGSPELVIRYYKGKSGFDSPKWNTQKMEVIEPQKQ
jgi:hypothetical protein